MQQLIKTLILVGLAAANIAIAQPEYNRIELEIDIDRPASEVWSKVGEDFCQLSEWLPVDCKIVSGDGGVGTIRLLNTPRGPVTEVMVARSELSYGYTFPFVEGEFNNLYHGFMEARPITNSTSKILYTLVYDISNLTTQTEREANIKGRTTVFQGALKSMKALAEDH